MSFELFEEQIMSLISIFSPKMEAIVFNIFFKYFSPTHAVLKIGEYFTIIPFALVGYEVIK